VQSNNGFLFESSLNSTPPANVTAALSNTSQQTVARYRVLAKRLTKMSNKRKFRYCRRCLKSNEDAAMQDLFDNDGENARKVQKISGVDV
jgi:hypothetical protein